MADSEVRETDEAGSLEEQLRLREAEIALLKEVTHVIASEYNLEKVFDLVATRARELIGAETITIPILSGDQRSYTYCAAVGENSEELLNATLPIEIGICGWVLRHRAPWWRGVLEHLDQNERNQWEQEAGTVILVPLVGKRRFLGGIAGINKAGGGEFNNRDLELLKMFASQVSIAIENAMFFEELDLAKRRAEAYREKLQDSNEKLSLINEELQHLAVHDPLTGQPNRTLILDRLQQGIHNAERNKQSLALIMIDLDHFKEINDTLGHTVGDELLIHVSSRFQSVLRSPDTLGRLGGDEFAVVVPEADKEAAIVVASKLQAAVQIPVEIDHNTFTVGASMGIALYPDNGENPSTLLKSADVAMYVAKRNRDEYAIYDPLHDHYNPDRLALLRDLRAAIQNEEIGLAFQPKLDLRQGKIIGVEALARWKHSVRGDVSPNEFIPILEQTGLIKPFTLNILEQAVRYCTRCRRAGFELSVAVNLSAHNLRDDKLPGHIATILNRSGMDEGKLMLEITESAIMNDPELSLGVLNDLDTMGIHLSVDDFGTGYSSLSYLKRLPVKQLKIDQSFVSDMIEDKDDSMIVQSTIDLAHNLGLNTVAEGVETQDVLTELERMGCDMAQGFLISHPLTPDELLNFLRTSQWIRCGTDRGHAENF